MRFGDNLGGRFELGKILGVKRYLDLLGDRLSGVWGDAVKHLSLLRHYNNFLGGVFDSGSFILLLSYVVLGVVFTSQSIEYLRFARR